MTRTNLPVEVSSFVGRAHELKLIADRLASAHVVTLTGTGGCGKTRLARQVARRVGRAYPGGVWLVELADVADSRLVLEAIAHVVGVPEGPRNLEARLIDVLRPRRVLLVLDNCEQVLGACAELVLRLVQACPRLRIVATSRQAFGIPGESTVRVPSLALPGPHAAHDPKGLAEIESVRLFVDRARARQPSFDVDGRNVTAIVEICRRLDGIPLALELAAAWVAVLSPGQLAARLADELALLSAGAHAPRRHQTLRALVDWSHNLLSQPEQVLFRRLAVFGGSWTLEAAEAICAGDELGAIEPSVLEVLAGLVDKSVVQSEPGSSAQDGTRYRVLAPLHEYALERLRAAGEEAQLRQRHRDWLLALTEEAEMRWRGSDEAAWLARIGAEHDNIRAALAWASGRTLHGADGGRTPHESDIVDGLRLASSLWWFWIMRGYLAEGREHLRVLLAQADWLDSSMPMERARALQTAGRLTHMAGELDQAQRLLDASLRLWQAAGSHVPGLDIRHDLALIAHAAGDLERALALQSDVLGDARALGDTVRIYRSLYHLGEVATDLRQYERAQTLLEEALERARAAGDARGTAISAAGLGRVRLALGDPHRAADLYRDGIRLLVDLDDRRRLAISVMGLAAVALHSGDSPRAANLGGLADQLAATLPSSLPPSWLDIRDQVRLGLLAALGAAAMDAAWAAGRAMPVAAVLEAAHPSTDVAPRAAAHTSALSALSAREREVALLVAEGYSNPRIAERLVITRRTADTHVQNILSKLGLHSRAEIAAWTVEQRRDT